MSRSIRFAMPLAAAALALAGCSGGSGKQNDPYAGPSMMSSAQLAAIQAKSVALMSSATSVHVSGTWHAQDGSAITFDIALDNAGDAAGTMHVRAAGKDMDFTIRRVGARYWQQITASFISEEAALQGRALHNTDIAAVAKYLDKWVLVDMTVGIYKDLATMYDMKTFTARPQSGEALTELAGPAAGDRQPVYMLGGDKWHRYEIAATGQPYLVGSTVFYADNSTDLTSFADWNNAAAITAPSGDELAQLPSS